MDIPNNAMRDAATIITAYASERGVSHDGLLPKACFGVAIAQDAAVGYYSFLSVGSDESASSWVTIKVTSAPLWISFRGIKNTNGTAVDLSYLTCLDFE